MRAWAQVCRTRQEAVARPLVGTGRLCQLDWPRHTHHELYREGATSKPIRAGAYAALTRYCLTGRDSCLPRTELPVLSGNPFAHRSGG